MSHSNLTCSGLGDDIDADSTTTCTHDPFGKLPAAEADGTASRSLTDRHADSAAVFTATGTGPAASVAYDPLDRDATGYGLLPALAATGPDGPTPPPAGSTCRTAATHAVPMGNNVSDLGNYVSAKRLDVGIT